MDFQRGDISFVSEDRQHQESAEPSIEREHMFDKVVTPSDVGKLNRLVIPKQHAEKYFPLDSAANEKGLLLSFEDRAGKPWRFRYSYWNSSQSYVMTKGWSRFVKDKRLDAGDTVSFGRGLNDTDRLFIDWKRRAAAPPLPPPPAPVIPAFAFRSPVTLWSPLYDRHRQLVYFQSSVAPRVLESVPVVRSSTKRVRLFGVNLECPETDDHAPLQLRLGGVVGEASSSEELQLDLDI